MADRIFISTLQAFCRAARLAVTFRRHGDIYTITDSDVRCRYLSDQSASLDPRLVLPLEGGLAYLDADGLQPLGDAGEFRLQQVERDGTLGLGLRALSWDQLTAEIAAKRGASALEVRHTGGLADLLLALGTCTEVEIGKAAGYKAPEETLGAALVRLGAITLDAVLEALIGPAYLYRQPAPGQDVVLPQADRAGEILFRQGLVSRSDLLHYELLGSKQGREALDLLVEEGRVTAQQARHARRREDLKRQARAQGKAPLGEILVMKGWVAQEVLDEVLSHQAALDPPPPLGHLLVDRGLLSPEHLAEGLRQQDERLDALIDRDLKAEEPSTRAGFKRGAAAASDPALGRRRRRAAAGGIATAALGLAVIGLLGYAAYSLGPGRSAVAVATPTPDPLGFLIAAAGRGGEGYMTISDVKRSAGRPAKGDLDVLENPEYVDESREVEEFVANQQAELDRFRGSAKAASRLASGVAGS
ncbi:MAG: hypothetical protein FJZ01_25295, partial [Candidatus Sericytochromatia bacterium]|nr:hypothetical protein [Candidatus Tanganyikabacteria bacterium]